MFAIKVSTPKHVQRNLLGMIKLYGYICPGCGIYLSQLSVEMTPGRCKICFVELPDARGLIDRPLCRIGYHTEKEHE
jgi:hypothetical protein